MNDMSPKSPSGAPASAANAKKLTAIPKAMAALLGPPPVVWGESSKDYNRALICLAQSLDPRDAVDWIMVKDIADANWEAQRMQRCIAALVKNGIPSAARSTLGYVRSHVERSVRDFGEFTPEENDVEHRALLAIAGAHRGRERFNKFLKFNNFTEFEMAAYSYSDQIRTMSELEQNKVRCDDKKARLLRDYERRQIARGRPLSMIGNDVTDLPADSVT